MNKFEHHYKAWRKTRINFLKSLIDVQGLRILEMGAGHGQVGEDLSHLGAKVLFAEGRPEHVEAMQDRMPLADVVQTDFDGFWLIPGDFDLVLHWGLLYHLNDWRTSLTCALAHAPYVCLETEVADSNDPFFEIKSEEKGFDQALGGIGSHPTAPMIEYFLGEQGATIVRYDVPSLNAEFHKYDWQVTESKTWNVGQRRFWMIKS